MRDAPAASLPHAAADAPRASRVQLRPGPWLTLLDALAGHFPQIAVETWRDRFARGRVLDVEGRALAADAPHRAGLTVQYFREVAVEPRIPFDAMVLYEDDELLVADKPHFLPVTPAGAWVRETLLARLVARSGNAELAPLHRLDRGTAGLVLFSQRAATRGKWQALFREPGRIEKTYEALAAPLPQHAFPLVRRSRLVAGEPFFRMQEVPGEPNSETQVAVLDASIPLWRYKLRPVTGKKHQLRVHMAALGVGIENDEVYPVLLGGTRNGLVAVAGDEDEGAVTSDDYARPLKLLARRLRFDDPLTRAKRVFESGRAL